MSEEQRTEAILELLKGIQLAKAISKTLVDKEIPIKTTVIGLCTVLAGIIKTNELPLSYVFKMIEKLSVMGDTNEQ